MKHSDLVSVSALRSGLANHLVLDGLLHGPQVDRDVRRIRHQASVGPEHGAGEVQTLLDVRGDGGPLEDSAHLLCNGPQDKHTGQQLSFTIASLNPSEHFFESAVPPAMLMKRWEKMESCTVLSSVPMAH